MFKTLVQRPGAQNTKKHAQLFLSPEHINGSLEVDCCEGNCLKQFNSDVMYTLRHHYHSMKHADKTSFLVRKINECMTLDEERDEYIIVYKVKAREVCIYAFLLLYDATKYKYDVAFDVVQKGGDEFVQKIHGNEDGARMTPKADYAYAWFTEYINNIGDVMPDSANVHLSTETNTNAVN